MTASGAGPWPLEIRVARAEQVRWRSTSTTAPAFRYPAELLRVESPSAEVQGHGRAEGDARRQAPRRHHRARAGRQLRRPDHVRRWPQHRDLLLALSVPARARAGRDLARLRRGAGEAKGFRAKVVSPRAEAGMTLRLLHTADWQLGKPFRKLPGEAAALLRDARFEAVRTARRARERARGGGRAGGRRRVRRQSGGRAHRRRGRLPPCASFAGPWVLLPGNHDAALAARRVEPPASGWASRPTCSLAGRSRCRSSLADGPSRGVAGAADRAPRARRPDRPGWTTPTTPPGAVRIGLAHGSVAGRLPGVADAANPIAGERAERARLDYLALGDWHGTWRSRRGPGTPARPSPTGSPPTSRQRAAGRARRARRTAASRADRHRQLSLAPGRSGWDRPGPG